MKFLSFDIGIRNLAFTYAEYDEEKEDLKILEWDIINIAKSELDNNKKCSTISKRKPYKNWRAQARKVAAQFAAAVFLLDTGETGSRAAKKLKNPLSHALRTKKNMGLSQITSLNIV